MHVRRSVDSLIFSEWESQQASRIEFSSYNAIGACGASQQLPMDFLLRSSEFHSSFVYNLATIPY